MALHPLRTRQSSHPRRAGRAGRPRRAALLSSLMVVCLSATLAACSGDADEPAPGDGTPSTASTAGSGDAAGASEGAATPEQTELRDCRATVEVTGDVQASFTTDGQVRVRHDTGAEPSARYSATQGDDLVTVYSADDEIPYPAVTFSQGEKGFTSLEDDASQIDVATSGKGAEADLTLQGLDDSTVDIAVSFSCGRPAKAGTS